MRTLLAVLAGTASVALWLRSRRRSALQASSTPASSAAPPVAPLTPPADPAVWGVARATRHRYELAQPPPADAGAEGVLEAVDLLVAPALAAAAEAADEGEPLVVYVLDPEPVLFGAAALHCYAASGYYSRVPTGVPEALYSRIHVVGIGHEAASFGATAWQWQAPRLRHMRRRDFPPLDHPVLRPGGRVPNAAAARFVTALEAIFEYTEANLLPLHSSMNASSGGGGGGGGGGRRPRRALLGASYSASVALQLLLRSPTAIDDFILGSPSIPFDPELLEWLTEARVPLAAAADARAGAFIAYGALEREDGPAQPSAGSGNTCRVANVHRGIPDASHALAELLQDRGLEVDGAHEVAGEDHTSLKLTLVSRGIGWCVSRAASAAQAQATGGSATNK